MVAFRWRSAAFTLLFAATLHAQTPPGRSNSVSTALWFMHYNARPQSLTHERDRELKATLIEALRQSGGLTKQATSQLLDPSAFEKLSGGQATLTVDSMETHRQQSLPKSRMALNAKLRDHADLLTTQFDMIGETHRAPAGQLVDWIVKNYQAGKPLGVIIICTGNTRRSMLGAAMGNLAAAYYGLSDLRFSSGGTDPVAFNPRTIASLKAIGFDIEPTGQSATVGSAGEANPIYRMRWGQELEALEFSKKYSDAHNPRKDFAAILVCSEADASCPKVTGASIRIPVPYLDPKAFDGAPFEAAKYAERRDDIGRFMLSTIMQARRQLEIAGKLN